MIDMIRNCNHYSHHSTYLERDGQGKVIRVRKVAFDEIGAEELKREAKGITWYSEKSGIRCREVILDQSLRRRYGFLVLNYFDGKQIYLPKAPDSILGEIQVAVDHYFEIFRKDNYAVSHGDYSICNHVFGWQEVVWITDWEHFNWNLPLGYDVVYCILEPFLFWINAGKKCSDGSLSVAKGLLTLANKEIGFDDEILHRPATWLKESAEKNRIVFGEQLRKVPFVATEKDKVKYLDKLIQKAHV